MTRLEIDSQSKTIHAELDLKGEAQPIVIDVNGYKLVESSGKTRLQFTEVRFSREWMNTAFQQFSNRDGLEIPELLRLLL